jgi:hypothetical protein
VTQFYGVKMVEKNVVRQTVCDGCGRAEDGEPESWLHVISSHGDWGNDSGDSFEYRDACSARCFLAVALQVVIDYGTGHTRPTLSLSVDFNLSVLCGLIDATREDF